MKRDPITTWVAMLIVAAVTAISSGGVGAFHRHTVHPPAQNHVHEHSHSHNDSGHCSHSTDQSEDEKAPPSCPDEHKDCDLCLLIMTGGQWSPVEVPTYAYLIETASAANSADIVAPESNLRSVIHARGPPLRSV